jgi:hypothetical protein
MSGSQAPRDPANPGSLRNDSVFHIASPRTHVHLQPIRARRGCRTAQRQLDPAQQVVELVGNELRWSRCEGGTASTHATATIKRHVVAPRGRRCWGRMKNAVREAPPAVAGQRAASGDNTIDQGGVNERQWRTRQQLRCRANWRPLARSPHRSDPVDRSGAPRTEREQQSVGRGPMCEDPRSFGGAGRTTRGGEIVKNQLSRPGGEGSVTGQRRCNMAGDEGNRTCFPRTALLQQLSLVLRGEKSFRCSFVAEQAGRQRSAREAPWRVALKGVATRPHTRISQLDRRGCSVSIVRPTQTLFPPTISPSDGLALARGKHGGTYSAARVLPRAFAVSRPASHRLSAPGRFAPERTIRVGMRFNVPR